MAFATPGTAANQTNAGITIGLVIVSLRTAGYESAHLDECPRGVAIGNDEIWWKSLNPRDRDRFTDGGLKEAAARRGIATVRGPKGQDVCWNPTVVDDPPMRVIEGKLSAGFNLDGTTDGHATSNTCRHEKFDTPDGQPRVDNQMWRLVGCIHGWRSQGYIETTSDTERRNSSQGVILIQIAGVQSLQESPDVTVRFFRAADVMPKNSSGDILPFASYRIDGNPRYGATAHGRIHDGVLTTDPIDAHLPFYGNRVETEFYIRGMRLNVKLGDDRASGMIGGYHDLDNWWDYVRKMGYLIETAQFDCPALYEAARRLADGYPDPRTGNCSALSVAYNFDAVRAFVIDTPKPIALPEAAADGVDVAALPVGIAPHDTALGEVLSDLDGRTLYVSEAERCAADCASLFKPLDAPWTAAPKAPWSMQDAGDRVRQWAFKGKAVFTCVRDQKAGDARCVSDRWQPIIVKPRAALPSWIKVQPSELGPIVADQRGHTMYRLLGSLAEFKKEICDDVCLADQWQLVTAGGDVSPQGAWTVVAVNGTRAWAFKGSPLYTFAGDTGPSEIAGHRFGGASVSAKNWFTAIRLDEATSASSAPNTQEAVP